MSRTLKITQEERERIVLDDLERHFPGFSAAPVLWRKVPRGQDPPDFVGDAPAGRLGLELTEWLDGEQMTAAKTRESSRTQVHRILGTNWKHEYQPKNFRGAFIITGRERIARKDEAPLRKEFFAHAAEVDAAWLTNPERCGISYYTAEFPGYPLLAKYFNVRYIGGEPNGLCWIHSDSDGGAYDPFDSVAALIGVIQKKLNDYSAPAQQARLKAHDLEHLNLLVHGGFNAYAYNTPSGPLSLEEIARRASEFYVAHAHHDVFDRVWFFDSLDSADDVNKVLGIHPGRGRVRWLAQLWPEFRVYEGGCS